jgi:H+-transporting ATPase
MVDPSDDGSSSASTPRGLPATHITIEIPTKHDTRHDIEKEARNGYAFTGAHKPTRKPDDDEDEDLNQLIEELESLDPDDPHIDDDLVTVGGARHVPEEMLQTDIRVGLSDPEIVMRRKKYGLNVMKEEKENLFLKFLGYFVGPIQLVMEVSGPAFSSVYCTRSSAEYDNAKVLG